MIELTLIEQNELARLRRDWNETKYKIKVQRAHDGTQRGDGKIGMKQDIVHC